MTRRRVTEARMKTAAKMAAEHGVRVSLNIANGSIDFEPAPANDEQPAIDEAAAMEAKMAERMGGPQR